MKKKTFDAVAFMRTRREELSRAYAGLTAEQIEERIQQALKDDPLWRHRSDEQAPSKNRERPNSPNDKRTLMGRERKKIKGTVSDEVTATNDKAGTGPAPTGSKGEKSKRGWSDVLDNLDYSSGPGDNIYVYG